MTLTGYRFMATGVTEYAFYHGSDRFLRVCHTTMLPVRIFYGHWYTVTVPEQVHAGSEVAVLDEQGVEIAWLHLWASYRFAVSSDCCALTGRVIQRHLRKHILYTALDDEKAATVEYRFNRSEQRQAYGEWVPQRYVATVNGELDLTTAIAIAAPLLDIPGIEIG